MESEDTEAYEVPREVEQNQFIFQKWEEAWRLGFLRLGISDDDAFFVVADLILYWIISNQITLEQQKSGRKIIWLYNLT